MSVRKLLESRESDVIQEGVLLRNPLIFDSDFSNEHLGENGRDSNTPVTIGDQPKLESLLNTRLSAAARYTGPFHI
jgi:hypothetical protein